MTLLEAGAVVAGSGSSWASSTKWPSGSCTMTARVLLAVLIASGAPPVVTTGTPGGLQLRERGIEVAHQQDQRDRARVLHAAPHRACARRR